MSCTLGNRAHKRETHKMADPYQWLEEVEGPQALNWVNSQNARTLKELEGDVNYEKYFTEAKNILTAKDRIDYGRIRGAYAYSFWQDQKAVRGLWRRSLVEPYIAGNPQWEILLNFDELAEKEKKNWVYRGANCLAPKFERCLLTLSDGGKDASVIREFDVVKKTFVEDGFYLPEAKSYVTWLDKDHLLVSTKFDGADSLTNSGYPRRIKTWKRGTPLKKATTILEGDKKDVGVWSSRLESHDQVIILLYRALDFYNNKYWLWHKQKKVELQLPTHMELAGFFKGQLIFSLRFNWGPIKRVHLFPLTLIIL